MSKKFAMVLCVYLLIGFAVAVFHVVGDAGRGFVNDATIGSAAAKGIVWPATLYSALADG